MNPTGPMNLAGPPKVAIIHNVPVSYKHLLFSRLAAMQLDFEVLFTARQSGRVISPVDLSGAPYRYRILIDGPFEKRSVIGSLRGAWKALDEIAPQVLIVSGWFDYSSWGGLLWAKRNRRPCILWAESNHFDFRRVFWKEMVKRAFVRQFQAVHVYGTSNAEYLVRLGFDPNRIIFKRAVVDTELFVRALDYDTSPDKPLTLIYVGRLAPEKNLAILLRALAIVKQKGGSARVKLLIVGSGKLEADLKGMSKTLGLDGTVTFAGPVFGKPLVDLYSSAHVLILPSKREQWGLVVLEGMCCGLPAIVSDQCGCCKDLVLPNTGWPISPFEEVGLARLLEQIAAMDRAVLKRMGQAGRSLASTYSAAACATIVAKSVSEVYSASIARTAVAAG